MIRVPKDGRWETVRDTRVPDLSMLAWSVREIIGTRPAAAVTWTPGGSWAISAQDLDPAFAAVRQALGKHERIRPMRGQSRDHRGRELKLRCWRRTCGVPAIGLEVGDVLAEGGGSDADGRAIEAVLAPGWESRGVACFTCLVVMAAGRPRRWARARAAPARAAGVIRYTPGRPQKHPGGASGCAGPPYTDRYA